jgi:AhpC/TSA family
MSVAKPKDILEVITNIFVVVIGLGLLGLYISNNYFPKAKTYDAEVLTRGKGFTGLEEIDFSTHRNNIVVAFSTKCPYCTQSLPFLQSLLEINKDSDNVRIIAVFPQPQDEIDRYLVEHKINNLKTIPNFKLIDSSVEMTPTIVWINSSKQIARSWEGYLDRGGQDDFWSYYNGKLAPK